MLCASDTVKDFIFLSKNSADEYINYMAKAAGGTITDTRKFDYAASQSPIVMRGILKHKIMKQCWQDRRDFYYVDTGYFDHWLAQQSQRSYKLYHRVVRNNLQHDVIVERPDDRWHRLGIALSARRHGRRIVLAVPDDKPCKFYGIDRQQWIDRTIGMLKQHSDRPVVVRDRAAIREHRTVADPLCQVLQQDVHALVTFNSVAAIESILSGVPAIVLAPCHAALPVANSDLSSIENPYWPDKDKLHAWACHLAYGQFHVAELKNGQALKVAYEN